MSEMSDTMTLIARTDGAWCGIDCLFLREEESGWKCTVFNKPLEDENLFRSGEIKCTRCDKCFSMENTT